MEAREQYTATSGGYDPRVVANTLIDLALDDNQTLTPLKLQKLVYISDGWSTALNGRRIVDESPEAWPHGPVYRPLYHEFKRFGRNPIDSYYKEIDLDEFKEAIPRVEDEDMKSVIEKVWKGYGSLSATKLSALTHQDGTPWSETKDRDGEGAPIPDASIKRHFDELEARVSNRLNGSDA